MKLRLIVVMLALAAGSGACFDLTTAPRLEPGARESPAGLGAGGRAASTERGGTTMGSGD